MNFPKIPVLRVAYPKMMELDSDWIGRPEREEGADKVVGRGFEPRLRPVGCSWWDVLLQEFSFFR